MNTKIIGWLSVVGAVVGAAGCTADAGVGVGEGAAEHVPPGASSEYGENVATTQQAFSGTVLSTHSRSDNLPTSANKRDLGSSSGVTCFLAGVGGNLSSSLGAMAPSGTLYTSAEVRVYEGGGHWWLETRSGKGSPDDIIGKAMCVSSVSGRLAEKGWSYGGPVQLDEGYPANPARRCYLTSVRNSDPIYADDGFGSSGDQVRVWQDPVTSKWYLGGSGDAAGSARCINVTGSYGLGGQVGATTMELGYNFGGVACALTAVQGRFRSNDYAAGVFITWDAGLRKYYLTSTSGRATEGQCFW
jgi:hypothetical protein